MSQRTSQALSSPIVILKEVKDRTVAFGLMLVRCLLTTSTQKLLFSIRVVCSN